MSKPVPVVERPNTTPQRGLPPFRGARAAFALLSRVPVGGFPYSAADWRWAAAWYPLVGLVLGLVQAIAFVALRSAGATVAAAGAVTVGLLLTGALHEDGLADTADALGGSHEPEGLFAILKDSRIGTYGAAALTMALLLRVSAMSALDPRVLAALPLAGALSRVFPVWLMATLDYVTPEAVARNRAVAQGGALQATMATLIGVGCAAAAAVLFPRALHPIEIGAATLAATVAAVLAARTFRRRAGGVTGDFLGAAQQVCEIVLLVAFAASARVPPQPPG
jgi:adenosylcobinamide-GDP ribazoletransferase